MTKIHFGVQYNGVSMASVIGPLEFAERAETWGYESFFAPDLETLPSLDPMVLLPAVSQRATKMMLGTGVMALPFRNPYQLAKAAVSLDTLSNERLILGLGVGLLPLDFHVQQVDMRQRGKITDELLGVLSSFLDGETVTHHGKFYDVESTTLAPKPSRHIPIWLGGSWDNGFSDAALRRVAEFGDGFHPTDVPVEGYAEGIKRISELAVGYGRDATKMEWACNMWLCMGKSKDEALVEVNAALKHRFGDDAWEADPNACYAIGTANDCIETIEAYVAIGVSTFVMNVLSKPDRLLINYEEFALEVAPHSRR